MFLKRSRKKITTEKRSFGKFLTASKANSKNGVLEIKVPKADRKKPEQININVE